MDLKRQYDQSEILFTLYKESEVSYDNSIEEIVTLTEAQESQKVNVRKLLEERLEQLQLQNELQDLDDEFQRCY